MKLSSLRDYMILMRPVGWAPFIFALLFGILDSGLHFTTAVLLFIVWGPLIHGGMMALNFYSDVATDSLNHTMKAAVRMSSQPLVTGRVKKRNGLIFAMTLSASGLVLSAFLGPAVLLLAALNIAIQYAYSVGPRLKSKPFADVAANCASAMISYAVPWSTAGFLPWQPAAWIGLFVSSLYILSIITDIMPDKAAGIRTTAVFLGHRKASLLGLSIYAASLAFFYASGLAVSVHYILMIPFLAGGLFAYALIFFRPAAANSIVNLMYYGGMVFFIILFLYYLAGRYYLPNLLFLL